MGGVGSTVFAMVRRLPLTLAIALACSTVLAGVPRIAAASDPQTGPVILPLPFDPERVSESRGEATEKEREEEESADAELDLFTRPRIAVLLDMRCTGRTAPDSSRATAGSCDSARFIRGPPAG
jgi:hypothetical protein